MEQGELGRFRLAEELDGRGPPGAEAAESDDTPRPVLRMRDEHSLAELVGMYPRGTAG